VDVGRALHLSFDFALGMQDKNAEVLASFYPHQPEDWRGGTVTFYPFLTVTKREGRDKAVWLPYWHVTQACVLTAESFEMYIKPIAKLPLFLSS